MSITKSFIEFIDNNKYMFINGLISKIDSGIEWVQDPEDEPSEEEFFNNKSYYSNDLYDELIFEMEC